MIRPFLFALIFASSFTSCLAQKKSKAPIPTAGESRLDNAEIRARLAERSIVNGLEFTSIGPTIMSGRVVDIAVNPTNPTEFYVAYASGGLWHTNNNGTSFKPIFDNEIVNTIGAIAVDWNSGHIWIGTGEVNSSRSSYAGTGIYVSEDRGETWDYRGLPESHHIGRVILHPNNNQVALVAVLGHLYTPNEERG
ncbi:MAG: glycosyl hydrolase, partial [Flavobacteriales bacterium]|nr:glycosyl hydrolase [Flavobacteriales bacterium]